MGHGAAGTTVYFTTCVYTPSPRVPRLESPSEERFNVLSEDREEHTHISHGIMVNVYYTPINDYK